VGLASIEQRDKSKIDVGADVVKIKFYENEEDNEFLVTDSDFNTLIYKGNLLNGEISLVMFMWRMRYESTIYGIGLPEILENDQELLDKVGNMSINQLLLSITSSGFYGGTGDVSENDMILEPKLKKLRDAEKIQFLKIPAPDRNVLYWTEDIRNEADEMSGVTKSLSGESVGKTLGEAVLNREAGLRRLSNPLDNIEFALERHARLRIDNLQRIYGRATKTQLVLDEFGNIIDDKLFKEYAEERGQFGETPELIQKFPQGANGEVFRNQFKEERMPFEKDEDGQIQPSEQDKWLEILPSEVEGEYDVKIRALSTIPMSKELESSKALETFNIVAQLPYTDIYKAEKRLLKMRGEDPDEWMQTQEEIMQKQMMAGDAQSALGQQEQMAQQMEQAQQMSEMQPIPTEGGAPTQVPPNQLQQPASNAGLSQQVSQALQ
jgi:hypothetical protein